MPRAKAPARIAQCFTTEECTLTISQACDRGMVQAIDDLRPAPSDTTAVVSIPK